MVVSRYLEERARRAKQVYEAIVQWSPPDFQGLSATTVKSSILSGTGKYVLKEMLNCGAITDGERQRLLPALEYGRTVFDHTEIRDAGLGIGERVFANVFDALLGSKGLGDDQTGSHRIYRGHFDSTWQLIPSYYRSSPRRADNISPRVRSGRLAYLGKKFPGVDFSSLTELEQEAVIQHYLSGTQLLDFTMSFAIAAFFATASLLALSDCPDFGVIYRISPRDISELLVGSVEAPELPSQFLRIHRQRGVFIKVNYRELINEPALFERWAFHHTEAGLNFESQFDGITQANLLPADIVKDS
ncbi:MAG TPA: FRG domain-containing protein [Pyrinomonadaceae bacterium]|jgi:hypothetical protein|nr:FRG domain-containing protein [Pyrinomonadaceae bacterium]